MNLFVLFGLFIGLTLSVLVHIHALQVSRRARSRAHNAAFWAGVSGLLSLPIALLASVAYFPYMLTGAGNNPIGAITTAAWLVALVLPVCSLIATLMAKRSSASLQATSGN